ncbi:MAG: glycoside hydrolase family 20 zincin-like fold domain-containing protein [bacterium]
MKKILLLCFLVYVGETSTGISQTVQLRYDTTSAQVNYAAKIQQQSLSDKGYATGEVKADYSIHLTVNPQKLEPEAYEIRRENKNINLTGGDGRGVIYGALSLAEDLENGVTLENLKEKREATALHFRAIKFDLPWDTYRHSYALTQHQETCRDLEFWKAFLDMMAKNRFNTLTLWNLHPYTFLIKPHNFPEASPWTEQEMKEWKTLFHGIFHLAKERGIDIYIMPFNIFVTPEFARAYNVAMNNLDHHHFVPGRRNGRHDPPATGELDTGYYN